MSAIRGIKRPKRTEQQPDQGESQRESIFESSPAQQSLRERKEAERLVAASERRLQALIENSSELIVLLDATGRLIEKWSSSGQRRLGYEAGELKGQCVFDYVHPEDLRRIQEAFQRLLRTPDEIASAEFRFPHKDGSWRVVEATAANLTHLPEVAGVVVNCRDVTDRKLAERTLRESEERFRRLFEEAPVGLTISDTEPRLLRANGAFCRMLGYDEAELLGRHACDLTHPDDRDAMIAAVRAHVAGEMPAYRMEKRFLAKNGETIWADVAVSLVRGDLGQPLYALGIIQDITDKKQADEQLRASQERLRQLAAYVVDAREEERTRIAREMHNELGQTLSALRMRLEDLAADCSADRASRAEIGRGIASVAEGLRTSIGSVKRICAELRPGVLDHFGLAAAIEWQAQEFESCTGIKCAIREMPENLAVTAQQSTAVFRILQEILTNVTQHSRASRACVRLRTGPKWLTLSVRDNGVGMRKDEANDPRSLGLLGMKERALLLGGTITFKGVRGKGTTVTLRLPTST